jgi:hypothetical protein
VLLTGTTFTWLQVLSGIRRDNREFHLLNKTIPISHIDPASAEERVANFRPLTDKDFVSFTK